MKNSLFFNFNLEEWIFLISFLNNIIYLNLILTSFIHFIILKSFFKKKNLQLILTIPGFLDTKASPGPVWVTRDKTILLSTQEIIILCGYIYENKIMFNFKIWK